MKLTRAISFFILFLLSLSGFGQSLKKNKRFYLKEKQISISKRKTLWHSFSIYEKNEYLDVTIYSLDSITNSDIKHIRFRLLDSDFKRVQPHYILGQRNIFPTSERKKYKHNNIDKVQQETETYFGSNYAMVKYPLGQKKVETYSSSSEEKHLSKGNYFLIVNYNHVPIDTIKINVK